MKLTPQMQTIRNYYQNIVIEYSIERYFNAIFNYYIHIVYYIHTNYEKHWWGGEQHKK